MDVLLLFLLGLLCGSIEYKLGKRYGSKYFRMKPDGLMVVIVSSFILGLVMTFFLGNILGWIYGFVFIGGSNAARVRLSRGSK